MKIKMIRSRFASGKNLEAGQEYDEEISSNDKAILVRMGSAEYVKPAPGQEPDPAPAVKLNKKSKVGKIKAELDRLEIEYDQDAVKADLFALLPEDSTV